MGKYGKYGIDILKEYLTFSEQKKFALNAIIENDVNYLYEILEMEFERHCDIIAMAFVWHLTNEGGQYWRELFNKIRIEQINKQYGFTQTNAN